MSSAIDADIVMLASTRWDNPYASAAFSLAKALSEKQRVFYIDNPVTYTEYYRRRKSLPMLKRKNALFHGEYFFHLPEEENARLIVVTPVATFPINWLPKGSVYDRADKLNQQRVAGTLNKLFRMFGVKRYIFVNSFNPLYDLIPKLVDLKPVLNIYHCVDDIRYAPYLSRHGVYKENRLMLSADFTLVTSGHLLRLKQQMGTKVFLLPNAANTQLFANAMKGSLPLPHELTHLRDRKVIAYVGNICQRIDYVLLKKLAAHHQDKVILMIGPEAPVYGNRADTYANASGLKAFDNVVFTGAKRQIELPAFLRYSDVCIIPFLCNDLTKSIYPLKINEYLSAGKPVVTTQFSEDIRAFSSVCYTAESDSHFVDLVDKAIHEDSEWRKIDRVTFSSSNNWEARAHHFIDITVEFLKHDDRRSGQPDRRTRVQAIRG